MTYMGDAPDEMAIVHFFHAREIDALTDAIARQATQVADLEHTIIKLTERASALEQLAERERAIRHREVAAVKAGTEYAMEFMLKHLQAERD